MYVNAQRLRCRYHCRGLYARISQPEHQVPIRRENDELLTSDYITSQGSAAGHNAEVKLCYNRQVIPLIVSRRFIIRNRVVTRQSHLFIHSVALGKSLYNRFL